MLHFRGNSSVGFCSPPEVSQTAHWHGGSVIHSKMETQLYLFTAKANQVLNNARLFISKSAPSSVPYVSSQNLG